MSDKRREERRQRSVAAKADAARRQQKRRMQKPIIVAVGVLALLAVAFLATQRNTQSGRVWSAEHGHWHDR